jgi:hypothetical protein
VGYKEIAMRREFSLVMRYSTVFRERCLYHLPISPRHDIQAGWGRNITCR